MKIAMLSTTDNPYNPFDEYDDWFDFDFSKGYNTPGYLARIAVVSNDLSESDQHRAIELAIDEIVKENINGMYVKVERNFEDSNL